MIRENSLFDRALNKAGISDERLARLREHYRITDESTEEDEREALFDLATSGPTSHWCSGCRR